MQVEHLKYHFIHVHDASNFAREALKDGRDCKVTTSLSGETFRITIRRAGTLDGYSIEVPATKTRSDGPILEAPHHWVRPDDLQKAVDLLQDEYLV